MNASWVKYLPRFIRARIESRHGLQAIIGNMGWLFADKILRMGVGLLVSVWIARYLGPAQFGLWNYSIAFAALFSSIAALGLDSIVVRELVKYPERQDELLGSAFVMKAFGGCVALILASIAISIVRSGESLMLWMILISTAGFIVQSANVIDFYFQAKVKSRFTVYAANGAFAIAAIVKVILVLNGAPLIYFAWIGLVEIALAAMFLVFAYRANSQNIRRWQFRADTAVRLLKECWPLMLSGVAVMVYMRIDQIMLGEMLGEREVGIFTAATKISEVWYFIPMVIAGSVFPAIILAKRQSEAAYLAKLQKLYDFMVILALSIAIPLTFFSSTIVGILYGAEYYQAGVVLAIHVWGGIFVFLGVASSNWYLTENLQRLAFYRTLFGAVLNVCANIILIPLLGVIGAAISTLISQFAAAYLFDALNKKTRDLFWMKSKSLYFFRRRAYA